MGIDLVNKDSTRSLLYCLIDSEIISVVDGAIGQRGKRLRFRVEIPFTVDEKTGNVEELNLTHSELMTPEELNEAIKMSKAKEFPGSF